MKYRIIYKLALLFTVALLCFSLAGCGAKSGDAAGEMVGTEYSAEDAGAEKAKAPQGKKIIEYIDIELETKNFDKLISDISGAVTGSGGYTESSEIQGVAYGGDGMRSASIVVRIPSDKSEGFTDFLAENSIITNKNITTEDVTLKYIDTESRISALKTEKAALEALLAKAESLNDIMAVQEKLTDVIAEIESYQSRLRSYDNLIDYTTVTLSISEVERSSAEGKQSVWLRIKDNLSDNFSVVIAFFEGLFVFGVSSLPYFIIVLPIGVIILLCIVIPKRNRKRKAEKLARQLETSENR